MVSHYIIMSSSYSKGKRIALDYVVEDTDGVKLKMVVESIVEKCGNDVSLSTHFIQTDSSNWNSVVEKDHFFKDVEVIKDISKFIRLINLDRQIDGLDVAKYILSKVQCTHLKLEKLVYMCYADYLCNKGEALFNDYIYAYKYGPVVKSVYDTYKKYGYKVIEEKIISGSLVHELPARSRIMFAINGLEKIKSIDETLSKYGKCTAGQLVDITHRSSTPWEITGKGIFTNRIIKNETIKKYHANEEI